MADNHEIKRPWLADKHVTISNEGVVFATDDFYKTTFFFNQCRIPRKLNSIRKSREGLRDNPIPSTSVDISKAFRSIVNPYLVVVDPSFHAIRSIKPEKKGINTI